jgi:hypothetical protein
MLIQLIWKDTLNRSKKSMQIIGSNYDVKLIYVRLNFQPCLSYKYSKYSLLRVIFSKIYNSLYNMDSKYQFQFSNAC